MTELLEQAVSHIRTLPPEQQDEVARVMLRIADGGRGPIPLSPDERKAIAESKAAARRDEFATEEDVRALWARYGL